MNIEIETSLMYSLPLDIARDGLFDDFCKTAIGAGERFETCTYRQSRLGGVVWRIGKRRTLEIAEKRSKKEEGCADEGSEGEFVEDENRGRSSTGKSSWRDRCEEFETFRDRLNLVRSLSNDAFYDAIDYFSELKCPVTSSKRYEYADAWSLSENLRYPTIIEESLALEIDTENSPLHESVLSHGEDDVSDNNMGLIFYNRISSYVRDESTDRLVRWSMRARLNEYHEISYQMEFECEKEFDVSSDDEYEKKTREIAVTNVCESLALPLFERFWPDGLRFESPRFVPPKETFDDLSNVTLRTGDSVPNRKSREILLERVSRWIRDEKYRRLGSRRSCLRGSDRRRRNRLDNPPRSRFLRDLDSKTRTREDEVSSNKIVERENDDDDNDDENGIEGADRDNDSQRDERLIVKKKFDGKRCYLTFSNGELWCESTRVSIDERNEKLFSGLYVYQGELCRRRNGPSRTRSRNAESRDVSTDISTNRSGEEEYAENIDVVVINEIVFAIDHRLVVANGNSPLSRQFEQTEYAPSFEQQEVDSAYVIGRNVDLWPEIVRLYETDERTHEIVTRYLNRAIEVVRRDRAIAMDGRLTFHAFARQLFGARKKFDKQLRLVRYYQNVARNCKVAKKYNMLPLTIGDSNRILRKMALAWKRNENDDYVARNVSNDTEAFIEFDSTAKEIELGASSQSSRKRVVSRSVAPTRNVSGRRSLYCDVSRPLFVTTKRQNPLDETIDDKDADTSYGENERASPTRERTSARSVYESFGETLDTNFFVNRDFAKNQPNVDDDRYRCELIRETKRDHADDRVIRDFESDVSELIDRYENLPSDGWLIGLDDIDDSTRSSNADATVASSSGGSSSTSTSQRYSYVKIKSRQTVEISVADDLSHISTSDGIYAVRCPLLTSPSVDSSTSSYDDVGSDDVTTSVSGWKLANVAAASNANATSRTTRGCILWIHGLPLSGSTDFYRIAEFAYRDAESLTFLRFREDKGKPDSSKKVNSILENRGSKERNVI